MSDPQPTDNLNVIKDWKAGKNARNSHESLWCKDGVLWSYQRKIGHRTKAGVCVVADLTLEDVPRTYNTKITLSHIKLAKRFADTIFHQLVSESSPLFMEELPF
jgi:hypothetical protein